MRISFPKILFSALALTASAPFQVSAMNKAELIDAMASSSGLSKADAKRALDGLLDSLVLGLQHRSRGGDYNSSRSNRGAVYIPSFGAIVSRGPEICDGLDNDCDGLGFYCESPEDGPPGLFCTGKICDGVNDSSEVSSATCDGVDDDCDLVLDDDSHSLSTNELIFLADLDTDLDGDGLDDFVLGRYYFNYWIEIILGLAQELDLRANQTYRCSDGSCVDSSLEPSMNPSPGTTYKWNYMETVNFWMEVLNSVFKDEAPKGAKLEGDFRGHVTVLKAALTSGGLVGNFANKAGLSQNLEFFVGEYLEKAVAALEVKPIRLELSARFADDTEAVTKQIAYELGRGKIEFVFDAFEMQARQLDASPNMFVRRTVRGENAAESPLYDERAGGATNPLFTSQDQWQNLLVKAKRALDAFIAATAGALQKGDRVSLVGFGSFSVSKRAARTGRNPQTGKEIKIAAKNVVRFKAGSELSKKVN